MRSLCTLALPHRKVRCEFLNWGAGSGVFAKLFLDRLRALSPDVYARTTYLVTDGSAMILEAQARRGILDAHADRVATRVLDVPGNFSRLGVFDAILGTYILDSLPFDLSAVNDRRIWRKERRSIVEGENEKQAQALRDALADAEDEPLADWLWIGPQIGLQT